jgi:hypothetical protein
VRDRVLPHRVEHARKVVTQFGEVEVAVGIDEHQVSGIGYQVSVRRRIAAVGVNADTTGT